jgi:glycosyltransferase involved in cell wall biosynthesis
MVSAIIPARNEEASIARAVESVAAQPEIEEVIVVDDESTDRTLEVLAELAARIPKLRVLQAGPLPPGWTGKNHALATGAAAAQGDWLLFTDADTFHLPGSTARALNDATDHNAVLVSYSPEQEMDTFWERALIPVVYCQLAENFSYVRVNDPKSPVAAANGQFLLILRDVYCVIGGFESIAGELLDDVALAQRVKQAGYVIYFTAPIGVVRTRMYRSLRAMWQGWTKNLYLLMGGRAERLLRDFVVVRALPFIVVALLLGYLTWKGRSALALAGVALCAAALHGRYAVRLYRNLLPLSLIKYYVPGMCMYSAALVASWWKTTHGAVIWKDRTYTPRAAIGQESREDANLQELTRR